MADTRSTQTNYVATGQDGGSPTNFVDATTAAAQAAAQKYGLLAPRNAATFPQFVPGYSQYANLAAQMQDAMGMPARYSQSPFWGNGAGRYAYGSAPFGTPPYGNPAGRNAPWWVTGANGQGGQYPNPGTILGQGQSQVPPGQPGAYTGGQGLLGQPKVATDNFPGLLAGLNPQQPNVAQPGATSAPGQGPLGAAPGAPQATTTPTATAPGYGMTNQFMSQFNAAPDNNALQQLMRNNFQGFRDLMLQGLLSKDQASQISGGLGDPNSYARVTLR